MIYKRYPVLQKPPPPGKPGILYAWPGDADEADSATFFFLSIAAILCDATDPEDLFRSFTIL